MAAAQKLVPVLVDCSERGQNEALMKKYGIQGFPTVVYTDPDGKQIREMDSRDPAGVLREIDGVAQKNPGRPTIWQGSLKSALELGKRAKKPVALVLVDPKADLVKLTAKLMKDLGDRKSRLLWVLEPARGDILSRYKAETAPAVVLIDSKTDVASPPIALKEDGKADELTKPLDEALKAVRK